MDDKEPQSGLVDTLRGLPSRRQVLKGGVMTGAALVWAVPVVEILTTASASASQPSVTNGGNSPANNLSWVDLIFFVPPAKEGDTPTFYVWSSTTNTFQANTDGFGNISGTEFSGFSFYGDVKMKTVHKKTQFTGFSTMTGYSISSSIDTAGDLNFTASGTPPTGLVLAYVLVHGGAKAYDSSIKGSAVVAYGGPGDPDTAKGPEPLDITVPTGTAASGNLSGTVASDMQTVTIDGKTYDMSFFVGNT